MESGLSRTGLADEMTAWSMFALSQRTSPKRTSPGGPPGDVAAENSGAGGGLRCWRLVLDQPHDAEPVVVQEVVLVDDETGGAEALGGAQVPAAVLVDLDGGLVQVHANRDLPRCLQRGKLESGERVDRAAVPPDGRG